MHDGCQEQKPGQSHNQIYKDDFKNKTIWVISLKQTAGGSIHWFCDDVIFLKLLQEF